MFNSAGRFRCKVCALRVFNSDLLRNQKYFYTPDEVLSFFNSLCYNLLRFHQLLCPQFLKVVISVGAPDFFSTCKLVCVCDCWSPLPINVQPHLGPKGATVLLLELHGTTGHKHIQEATLIFLLQDGT